MSSTADVRVVVRVPEGFGRAELAPPDLTQSPRLSIEQWESARDDAGSSLAWGCLSARASAWNVDATELAQDKLVELASKTAHAPLHAVRTASSGRERALASVSGEATARTFLAFSAPDRAHGCFVACESRDCARAVEDATLAGAIIDPPPPGLALGALSWAVHHPHEALAALGSVLVLGAALAIATRPGKRRKTKHSHS